MKKMSFIVFLAVLAAISNTCLKGIFPRTQFISDVEGSWDRVMSQADRIPGENYWNMNPNPPYNRLPDNNPEALLMIKHDHSSYIKEGGKIRFGGDTTDTGPECKKVLTFVLNLKERYPDRVELIIGNRDLNKLRFKTELTVDALMLEGDDIFRNDRFRITDWKDKFEKWIKDGKNKIDGKIVPYQHGRDPLSVVNDKILKMKWMLDDTMGAGRLFEYVKKEHGFATDLQTFEELMSWIEPGGIWARYLQLGKIIHYDADINTLYMHGGVSNKNFGVVPGQPGTIENIPQWIAALNAWGQKVINAGLNGDMEGALLGIQYQEPEIVMAGNGQTKWGGPNPISVIQVRPWTPDYNLKPLDAEVAQKLLAQGVKCVCSGHSPIGQIAVMIKAVNGVLSVLSDTSATAPLRGSTIIFADGTITIYSTIYYKDNYFLKVKSSSADPNVGVQTDGLLTVNETLAASWSRAKSGAPYGEPNYQLKKDAFIIFNDDTPGGDTSVTVEYNERPTCTSQPKTFEIAKKQIYPVNAQGCTLKKINVTKITRACQHFDTACRTSPYLKKHLSYDTSPENPINNGTWHIEDNQIIKTE